jgi:hypothetical protein
MIGNELRGAAVALLLLAPSIARADGSQAALAQSLFDEAVKLMEQERYAEACPKLAESQRLDPAGGTLLNLGLCREKEGKLATAWTIYNEALSQAIKDGRKDRELTAKGRVEALEPMLAKIVIVVPEEVARLDGLEVTLDGVRIGHAAFGVQSPIDTGAHILTASAANKREWQDTVQVHQNGEVVRVAIPLLADAPVPPAPPVERPVLTPSPLRPAGVVIGGAGLASIVVGSIMGGLAIARRGDSNAECPMNRCSARGVALNEDAKTFAWVSNITFGVGIAALATGTIFFLVGKPTAQKNATVVPLAGPATAGAGLAGRF